MGEDEAANLTVLYVEILIRLYKGRIKNNSQLQIKIKEKNKNKKKKRKRELNNRKNSIYLMN